MDLSFRRLKVHKYLDVGEYDESMLRSECSEREEKRKTPWGGRNEAVGLQIRE